MYEEKRSMDRRTKIGKEDKRWKSGHMLRVEITLTLSAHCERVCFGCIFNSPAQTQLEHSSNIACEYGNYTYKGVTESFIILCPYSQLASSSEKEHHNKV